MAQRTLCGTPKEHCNGSSHPVNKGMHYPKSHQSPPEAFKCHARYLINVLNYQQIGPREFRPPDGSETRVLTKMSHFGGQIRGGKGGEKGEKTKRAAFKNRGGQ